MEKVKPVAVLTIAGSDSGGGAGIQADLRTFNALNCFGTSAITAVTAQNTLGITHIHGLSVSSVKAQIEAVMDDIEPVCIKIGMLYSPQIVRAVAETLRKYPALPIIFDPVMTASSGDSLSQGDLLIAFKEYLFPIVTLLTPNLPEAALLCEQPLNTIEDMQKAAGILLNNNLQSVLIKGGHLNGEKLVNFYQHQNGVVNIHPSKRIHTANLHGTGCTLSAAITAYLAQGDGIEKAIEKAGKYVNNAIMASVHTKIGEGSGPLYPNFENSLTIVIGKKQRGV